LDFELSGMSKIPEWQSKKVEEYLKLARPP
jgi:hypothetical protein